MSEGPFYEPVRTQPVVTLRDLRDEHPREVRRFPLYPEAGSYEDRDLAWTTDLFGLALVAVEWRGSDPDRMLRRDLRDFLRQVALWIGGASQPNVFVPIVGADLVLSVSREPAEARPRE